MKSEPNPPQGIAGYAALVTGGGSGIGLGAASRLVRDGAHVTICGRTEEKLAAAVTVLEQVAVDDPGSLGGTGTANRHRGLVSIANFKLRISD